MKVIFNYYSISSLFTAASCLLLFAVLCFGGKSTIITKSLAVFSLSVLGWSFFYFLWQLSHDPRIAMIFIKILMLFASFIPASYLFFVLSYTNQIEKNKSVLGTAFVYSFFLSLLTPTTLIVSSLETTKYHPLWPMAGSMLDVFLAVWLSIIILSNYFLYTQYKRESDKKGKGRLLFLLVGFSLSFLGGITNFFLWYRIPFPPIGNFIGPLFFLFVIYAIIKLELLNTDQAQSKITTFWNDISFNFLQGFSVITDNDTQIALKNYNNFSELEQSALLSLRAIRIEAKSKRIGAVDALRNIVSQSISSLQPKEEYDNRRTKQNLKYHLLKMVAYDQAEEGQILWELGFDEYPVRIMTRETKSRPPMFQVQSPSDYTYTSRNAYLALKREAIHDVTWRISYLEKQNK